jgi:hypothetical protein
MAGWRLTTMARGRIGCRRSILCLAVVLCAGCSAPQSIRTSPNRSALASASLTRSPVKGEKSATGSRNGTPVKRAIGDSIDLNAKALVQSMLARLPDRDSDSDGMTRIGVGQIRNQSRSRSGEFAEFRQRLARLFTQAAGDSRVQFTADANARNHYELQGAAYLITRDGFDVWELFLSVSPAEDSYSLWQADSAVYVLRQARPGQPQMLAR